MGSPLGSTIQPGSIASGATQNQFVNALTGATMNGGQFQGVPGYTGELTPNLNGSLANNVWNSWSPNAPGMSQIQNTMNQFGGQFGQQNGYNPYAGMPSSLGGAANLAGGSNGPTGKMGYGGFNANNANMNSPWQSAMMAGSGGGSFMPSGNQFSPNGYNMANGNGAGAMLGATAMGYGAGAPVSAQPAWQSMVDAQQQNIQAGSDQLAEQFNKGGGLFSTAYGDAQGQYKSNAAAQQNAQLSQAQLSSMLAAQGIQSGAQGQLAQQQLGMGNLQLGAGNLNLQGALGMNNMWNNNLQLGGQLGQQQLGAQQSADTAQYQNWFAQQSYNNPLLSMLYSQMNSYKPAPTQTQGWLAPVLSGVGAAAGGLAAFCWIAEAIYGTNDQRTHDVRKWLNGPFRRTKLGRLTMQLYMEIGQQVAWGVRRSSILRAIFTPLFNLALQKARNN